MILGVSQKFALEILEKGGVVAYPTDTVYGVGISILRCDDWLRRLSEIKKRPLSRPVSLAFSSVKDAMKYVDGDRYGKLLKMFLPGPYTFIVRKREDFTFPWEKVGVRVPDHPLVLNLAKEGPITSTSANFHGEKEVTVWKDVDVEVDYLLIGECKFRMPSTVVDLEDKKILRKGAGSEQIKEIIKFLNEVI